MKLHPIAVGLVAVVLVALAAFIAITLRSSTPANAIANFEDCAAAGNPIMESYPRQCRTPDGRTFVEDISSSSSSSSAENEANIRITSPFANAEISNPVTITGEARVFENAFSYRIVDSDGTLLIEGHGMADAPDMGQFGSFEETVAFPDPKGTTGTIEVFVYSARDGSEIDTVTIPVRFQSDDQLSVQAFFSNTQEDPDMLDCTEVHPVTRRIPRTTSVAASALTELLKGPSAGEADDGFITSIPTNAKVRSVTIVNGVARVDFDAGLTQGVAGSCKVQAIRAQIEKTLLQFDSVSSVVISVNGNSEEILQP